VLTEAAEPSSEPGAVEAQSVDALNAAIGTERRPATLTSGRNSADRVCRKKGGMFIYCSVGGMRGSVCVCKRSD
jgi:hypothetical protein